MSYNWVGDNIYIYGAEQKPETYLQGYGAMIPLKTPQTFSVLYHMTPIPSTYGHPTLTD